MKRYKFTVYLLALCFVTNTLSAQQSQQLSLVSQTDYIKLHKFIYWAANQQYRGTSKTLDSLRFPTYSEQSVYIANDGGTIIYPDTVPQQFGTLKTATLQNFDYTKSSQWVVNYHTCPKHIAVFRSKIGDGNSTISWEALYFQKLFDELFGSKNYYFINEDSISNGRISDSTQLIVFPAVKIEAQDYAYYVNQICKSITGFDTRIKAYLKRGGRIYCEGNGSLFLEAAGVVTKGTIDYSKTIAPDAQSFYSVADAASGLPISAVVSKASNKLYGTALPTVTDSKITSLISTANEKQSVVFTLSNENTLYSNQIVVNLGLTATQTSGSNAAQSLYTLQGILSSFCSQLDVFRTVRNSFNQNLIAGKNAVAYDVIDTFSVEITLRNLSDQPQSDISITETINPYLQFYKCVSGATGTISGNVLSFSGLSLNAHEEKKIVYLLTTPVPDSKTHEAVDKYLAEGTYLSAAENSTRYTSTQGAFSSSKNKAYADLLFSARLVGDADVNWKNILYLDYQPFKVFLNLENKSRTAAQDVVYTQYIPKDVPYYQSDQSINIPILRTPGGKFVTVMRGSNDQKNPEYDFDSDGLPDAWLDTASIYPKGYTLTEDSVYWANPWAHLKSGSNKLVFEDIDGDGVVAQDADGDGKVDVEEPGDKIRVWKVTWKINTMAGYEYYEPYCSYELWLDPPKQVELAAGVAKVYDSLTTDLQGAYYPFAPNIAQANKNDKAWERWMETDVNNKPIWKELILQSINNYEGYTFIDTAATHYKLRPTDKLIGRAPQPHNEFIAVVSMGGEEIDMTHWTPSQSLYSNVNYQTIFGEQKRMPIRTTYTYYAPLPNPLQFEYLNDRCTITDTTGKTLSQLPHRGKAVLQFDIDASTEYSYYWIRNMGHDVDYNDASEAAEGTDFEKLGDGVFGYFVYEIPKGMGGYSITLPRNQDGSFNMNEIVQINGAGFQKWIDNVNTHNTVEVWENALSYQIYIPQVLIPPAVDDDNHDGKDDWIDDRGDRFSSKTGFLHDAFMADNGEVYPPSSTVSHTDNLAGVVDSGWVAGADKTFGDDEFEALGKTHFTIKALFEGKGREGSLEISKGGTLVVEEIFGGSPWVISSHAMSSKSEGIDLSIQSSVEPSIVKVGVDTVYIKHTIEDKNEPHLFNINFDPYHASKGFSDAGFTVLVGTKDPCNLLSPAIAMPAIIDPTIESKTVTLIPMAATITNDALKSYPKTETGTFVEVRVEASNCSDDDWKNTTLAAQLPAGVSLVMQYVAYPRPLVPNDNVGVLEAGWRFNQPEGEVLVNLGNTIPLIQPTRRAYFVYLLKVDKSLSKGIYDISFKISGQKVHYTGTNNGALNYDLPVAQFCVADKNSNGSVKDFQKFVLGQTMLKQLEVTTQTAFKGLSEARWSLSDISAIDYKNIKDTLKPNGNKLSLQSIGKFPSKTASKFFILQPGIVDSYNSDEAELQLTTGQKLLFTYSGKDSVIESNALKVTPIGPKVRVTHRLFSINNAPIKPISSGVQYKSDEKIQVSTILTIKNFGVDISKNTTVSVEKGKFFDVIVDSLPKSAVVSDNTIKLSFGDLTQGEEKQLYLYFTLKTAIPKSVDITTLINKVDVIYTGTAIAASFHFEKDTNITTNLYDFEINEIQYSQIDEKSIRVTTKAFNKGIDADNVWLRIYPVIGEGAYEFSIADQQIAHFAANSEQSLSAEYTLPSIGKSLEMLSRVDDDDQFIETTEKNNTLKTGFILTDIAGLNKSDEHFSVYPSLFNSQLTFDYVLASAYSSLKISITNAQGQTVKTVNDAPANLGSNRVVLSNLAIPEGCYFYTIESQGELLSKGSVIKSNKME